MFSMRIRFAVCKSEKREKSRLADTKVWKAGGAGRATVLAVLRVAEGSVHTVWIYHRAPNAGMYVHSPESRLSITVL